MGTFDISMLLFEKSLLISEKLLILEALDSSLKSMRMVTMASFPVLMTCGMAGGLFFYFCKIPGGPLVGAMLGTILFKLFLAHGVNISFPPLLKTVAYIMVGTVIGSMFNPDMLVTLKNSWYMLLLSSGILVSAGILSAYLLYKTGMLSPIGSYLASSPGGMNALPSLAAQMGEEAPLILVFHITRMYMVLLSAPIIGRLLLR